MEIKEYLRVARNQWAPYVPGPAAPWSLRRVVHLHRRAGFAASWSEIQRDLAEGPKASIDRLLTGKAETQWTPSDFEPISSALADGAVHAHDPARLKAWWVYRMLFSPDPLGERLTLTWHNHFATSNVKVNDLAAMRRQNEIFREFARAPFGELLNRAVRDPALLTWLDAPSNRKGHPNENLAREAMELFTLGIGPYTENDVKEAARALTGWTVVDGEFAEVATRYDDGDKTILRRKGGWRGDDFVKMLLDHPATSERLAGRICEFLMGETERNPVSLRNRVSEIAALAAGLREHNLDMGWAVETVLRSEAFFADSNIRTKIAGPAEFVVGAVRALEMFDPPPSTLVLAEWVARLGQDLFYPPNVGGWPGGRSWITTRSMIARTNFAAALVEGKPVGRGEAFDPLALARKHGRGRDPVDMTAFFGELLLGISPDTKWQQPFVGLNSDRALSLILASPAAQLN